MEHAADRAAITQAVALSALRQIRLGQVTRARRTLLLDKLRALGLITWVGQPMRASHHQLPQATRAWLVPDEIAGLTEEGRCAYDVLAARRDSPDWPELAAQPFDAAC